MHPTPHPPPATRRLQRAVFCCSVLFTLGTALHAFVIVDPTLVGTMMREAGTADPADSAATFTFWFRAVGCVYILGNAAGLLAWRGRSRALWWTVWSVNATQALGVVLIPRSMWSAVVDAHGAWGVLPSAVTDGGALLLTVAMTASLVRHRGVWAGHRAARR